MMPIMRIRSLREPLGLFAGDVVVFYLALWLTLFLRYQSWPNWPLWKLHFWPFTFLFLIWLLVFFIYDLYKNQTSLSHQKLIPVLSYAHLVNVVIAITFFYFIPYFNIAPKINLFIFLFISFFLIVLWRKKFSPFVFRGQKEFITLVGGGEETETLISELKNNPKYNIEIISPEAISNFKNISPIIAIDNYNPQVISQLNNFYQLLLAGARFVTLDDLWEDIFGQIPVSLISERWFLENISNQPKFLYDFLKRLIDLLLGLILALFSLPFFPIVALFIKLDDGGKVFNRQQRVGRNGKLFTIWKFRSMKKGIVTRVGKILRSTRLDELPQLWSVVKGDLSLVGPRPELPEYAEMYRRAVPYYDARHLISPGLSGWGQIYQENHPHFKPSTEATRDKLSYDLYYLKNRSLWLDIKICLKTIGILLSVKGK